MQPTSKKLEQIYRAISLSLNSMASSLNSMASSLNSMASAHKSFTYFGFARFSTAHRKLAVQELTETAMRTGKFIVPATALIEKLRERGVHLPRLVVIEQAVTRAN
jgi:hypothetical protein